MATTLTSILVHVTYSTKHRQPIIPAELRPDLFAYTGGICRDMRSPLLHAGGVAEHVHLVLSLGKTEAISGVMLQVKRGTSSWIKNQRPGLQSLAWQDGYFAFSIGRDDVDAVRAYLDRQAEHHRQTGFQPEVLAFLHKYRIEYDPEHLWD